MIVIKLFSPESECCYIFSCIQDLTLPVPFKTMKFMYGVNQEAFLNMHHLINYVLNMRNLELKLEPSRNEKETWIGESTQTAGHLCQLKLILMTRQLTVRKSFKYISIMIMM